MYGKKNYVAQYCVTLELFCVRESWLYLVFPSLEYEYHHLVVFCPQISYSVLQGDEITFLREVTTRNLS